MPGMKPAVQMGTGDGVIKSAGALKGLDQDSKEAIFQKYLRGMYRSW